MFQFKSPLLFLANYLPRAAGELEGALEPSQFLELEDVYVSGPALIQGVVVTSFPMYRLISYSISKVPPHPESKSSQNIQVTESEENSFQQYIL